MKMKFFEPEGFSPGRLEALCSEKEVLFGIDAFTSGCTAGNELYSIGRLYREYAGYPQCLPVFTMSDHGVCWDVAYPWEAEVEATDRFFWSEGKIRDFARLSDKHCHRVLQPLVWYRRKHGIERSADARGTIAFPSHACPWTECEFDVDAYIKVLKELPSEMQPVSVCIYWTDVQRGLAKPFLDAGLPVYTAGHSKDVRYVDRFYDLLRHFRYTTGNALGTYTFYSVEMGIPFSLVGPDYCYLDISADGAERKVQEKPPVKQSLEDLFRGIFREITEEQRRKVSEQLGGEDGYLSSAEMNRIFREDLAKCGKSRFKCVWNTYRKYWKYRIKRLWS